MEDMKEIFFHEGFYNHMNNWILNLIAIHLFVGYKLDTNCIVHGNREM